MIMSTASFFFSFIIKHNKIFRIYIKGLGSRMTKICPIQYIDQNACKYKSAWDIFKNNNNKFENQSLWLLW